MLGPVGTFVAGVVAQLEGTLVIPLIGLALIFAGLYWAFTEHEHGKRKAIAAFSGGALAIMGPGLATALAGGIPH